MTKHLAHHAVASAARPTSARTRVLAATTIGAMALVVSPALPAVAGAAVPATARAGSPHVAMAPHAALALAQPAGKFTPRNCTEASGSASCDLYAMSGSTSILGSSVPIWGFSTTGAVGSATDPGPVLVVQQGDAVTVTLHNQLSEPVSLAFPGQSGITYAGGSGDDMSGAAANGTRTYTFTADRPGTFLYEAGHTTDGTRQVQMGLAGALVVLPPDGTAYGVSSTAYADEAVVVLSEIDPRLNANPAGFDMRDFKPAYRLINGKPFPASDPISTDQGHTVLLRYVNAGSQTHSMSLLGANQVEIAQDGHRSQFTTTVTAESITPGMTLDTLVQMPSGPESKIALYENAQHLDNNGQNNGDPSQVA
ncbi:MAG TPA: multicopper oxidase domain-containing protein, partial [Jatrophihabitans sp.]|nr:multicopper oxidase domain-containing protein [Jatrophihabitans sp.]